LKWPADSGSVRIPGEAPVHSSRLRMKLLKKRAQLQRRTFATIRHDRRRDVVVPVELPLLDHYRNAGQALQPALALVAAFALARDELPASAGAGSRIVLLGNEGAPVASWPALHGKKNEPLSTLQSFVGRVTE
jgi:hypothetical protein